MRGRPCALFVTATSGLLPALARADAAPASIPSIDYAAPASCPAVSEFAERLKARLGDAARAGSERFDPRRSLGVRIVAGDGAYVGQVWLTVGDRRSAAKTVAARECADLVDALALVAALAVQSDAVPPTDAAPPPAPADSGTPPGGGAPDRAPGTSSVPAAAEGPRGARFHVEAGGLVAFGPAPVAIFGGSVGAGWDGQGSGVFGPALGVAFSAGASPSVGEPGGTARFSWFVARGDVCALRVGVGAALRLRACLDADAGVLRGEGSDTVAPETSSRGWLAVGASAQIEIPLGDRFALHVRIGAEAPLRRDRFAFGDRDFFEVPFLVGEGSASAAAYFP